MKKIIIVLLISALSSISAIAQEDAPDINEIFLFDNFENGTANVVKQGVIKAKFNYGTISQKIYFIDKGVILQLAHPSTVPTVNIADRTFEHIKDGTYYEKIKAGSIYFYIEWKTNLRSVKVGVYGLESEASAVDNISHYEGQDGNVHKLDVNQKIKKTTENKYYIKSKSKFKYFSSFNALANIFKKHKEEIKEYIKIEKLNFDDPDDVKRAITYIAEYIEN